MEPVFSCAILPEIGGSFGALEWLPNFSRSSFGLGSIIILYLVVDIFACRMTDAEGQFLWGRRLCVAAYVTTIPLAHAVGRARLAVNDTFNRRHSMSISCWAPALPIATRM